MPRKKSHVWDTGALVQFFANNSNTVKFMKTIKSGKSVGYIPQLIFSEFYYKTWQKFGEQAAIVRTKTLRESPLNEYILTETDTYKVGKLKHDYSFLSLADTIVASTAIATHSDIISTDNDFSKLSEVKLIKIDY